MRSGRPLALLSLVAMLTASFAGAPAHAFSQITGEDGAAPTREGIVTVPLPPVPGQVNAPADAAPPADPANPQDPADPVLPATPDAPAAPNGNEVDPDAPEQSGQTAPTDVAPAEIVYGEERLPVPVRDLRRKLIEIAKSGDIEKLRPFIETGADGTAISLNQTDEDPIEVLKGASGDGDGVEVLAILLETLQAGHVHLDQDGDNEIYVWPYFTQVNLETLTKPQLVELFELVTAGDYQRMVGNGSYDFYRVGLSPEGRFEFFIAGD